MSALSSMSVADLAHAFRINPAAPLVQDKITYIFPQNVGFQMVQNGLLQGMAAQLCVQHGVTIWVHYNAKRSSYRLGQVVDIEDCRYLHGAVFIHREPAQQLGGPFLQLNQLPVLSPQMSQQFAALYPPQVAPGTSAIQIPAAPSTALASAAPAPASSQTAAPRAAISLPTGEKIPKPRNSWIIYRQEKHHLIAREHPDLHTSKISQVVSKMWRSESNEVRAHYAQLAEEDKAKHRIQYPGYKCSPRKSSQIKKRKTSKKEEAPVEVQISAVAAKKCPEATVTDTMNAGAHYAQANSFQGSDNDVSDFATAIAEYAMQQYQSEFIESDFFGLN